MNSIKISLIIPTRERAETLKFAIETALNQNLQTYEVIVSDNFSNDSTKEVFDSFSDSRLKYFNTGERLSMTENFNFALSKAKGDYIIVIGDDDGVMPNGIDKLHEFISNHPSDLYVWPRHAYIWPSDNTCPVIRRFSKNCSPKKVNLRAKLRGMLKKGLLLNSLMPNTYHSATHRRVFDEVKNKTGKCYQTTNPDEFMLFTLPVFCEYFVNVGEVITVDGHSPKSNSGSTFIDKKYGRMKFISEQTDYKFHSSIPSDDHVIVLMVIDTFLQARDLYPKFYCQYRINYSAMWAFAWRMFNSNEFMWPVKRRKALQAKENFNSITYLIFTFLHYINTFKQRFFNLISSRNTSLIQEFVISHPMNISEFVTFIHDKQSPRESS